MAETSAPRRLTGRVQRLVDEREFGFVAVVPAVGDYVEGAKVAEYFIHRNLFVSPPEFDRLVVGDWVTFDAQTTAKGLRGVNIERVG